MRFVRFSGGRTGLVIDRDGLKILDIAAGAGRLGTEDRAAADAIRSVLPGDGAGSWVDMIDRWDEVRWAFRSLIVSAEHGADDGLALQPFETTPLAAPLASPNIHVFAVGSNTVVHIQRAFKVMMNVDVTEAEARKSKNAGLPPLGFTIWPDTVVGHGATVTPPRGTLKLDYEGECAVYVKKGGRNLDRVDLWGYAAWNDFGVRDTHLKLAKESPWGPFSFNLVKNFDTGNGCGPWAVVDEGADLSRLRCVVKVNGEIRQDWTLSDMIYSFEETLGFISTYASLRPGDMMASGTGAGVALEMGVEGPQWLKPGDVVDVTLDGAGTLRNVIGGW